MSYILEALRRAEAERARGRVPDLHAQPVAAGAPSPRARARRPSALHAAAAGIALVAAAAGYWWSQTTTRARPAAAADAPAASAGPAGGSDRTAVDIAPAANPAPVAAATALPPAPRQAPALPIVVSAPLPPPQVRTATPVPIPIAALPPAERSELGRVAIGGSVYSDDPAARFVIVDGQLLHEGESTSRGLRVERIGARSVVLRWRERSVELPL